MCQICEPRHASNDFIADAWKRSCQAESIPEQLEQSPASPKSEFSLADQPDNAKMSFSDRRFSVAKGPSER